MKTMILKNWFYYVFRESTVSVTDKTGLSYGWYQFDLEFILIHVMRVVQTHRHLAQLTANLY